LLQYCGCVTARLISGTRDDSSARSISIGGEVFNGAGDRGTVIPASKAGLIR